MLFVTGPGHLPLQEEGPDEGGHLAPPPPAPQGAHRPAEEGEEGEGGETSAVGSTHEPHPITGVEDFIQDGVSKK